MKKFFLFATALAALASCTSEDFVGDEALRAANENGNNAIVFSSGLNTTTRATKTGSAAATDLNNQFVFAGTKSDGTTAPTTFVFDQYVANYVDGSAHSTESNSSGWEYVSYTPASTTSLGSGAEQSIKYWDYSTTQYDFAAYSLGAGAGATPTYATPSAIAAGTKSYTLQGTADQLKACYISDLVTAYNRGGVSDYGQVVQFSFRSLAAKIRLAFYETIPGYSVKDVKFYTAASPTALATDGTESDPTLFASSAVLPSGSGTMTVTFPTTGFDKRPGGSSENTDYNKAHVSFVAASEGTNVSSTLVLEDLANLAGAEKKEATGNVYLGRASNAATYAGGLVSGAGKYYTVLPFETGANLQLRIKYTLVSLDSSSEEIVVDNATAVIPAELAKWSPNYAYTYIFKISDMTNGSTGVDGSGNVITGLTPITLDAVVVDSEDGVQETITTVSTPSITTYTKGEVVTDNDEYKKDANIYIVVNNGTSNVELTPGTNAWLYTATVETGALQTITEQTVDNALMNGTYDSSAKTYTVTDANSKALVVTDVTEEKQTTDNTADLFSAITSILADDSPTGNAITVNGAKFYPEAAATYVFKYGVGGGTYTSTTAAAHNVALPGAISTGDVAYSFSSYASNDDSRPYGTGYVKRVSQDAEWTTVLVTHNTPNDPNAANFVGQEFKVHATAITPNYYYELYTTGGTATGIYVTVGEHTYTAEEVNSYNATLTGAVSDGDIIPANYQYKVIKVVN